jgi:hypothetical protein
MEATIVDRGMGMMTMTMINFKSPPGAPQLQDQLWEPEKGRSGEARTKA